PHVRWMAPSPLWSEARANGDSAAFLQPALLRFATDSFMDDFLSVLEADPSRLGELRAVPETWRGPAPKPADVEPTPAFRRTLRRQQQVAEAGGNGLVRAKTPVRPANPSPNAPPPRLKLYQPAHQRFYLVAANLVCRTPGF